MRRDREQLHAAIKAAAWAYAAQFGSNAATEALDRVKQEISDLQWSGSK
jgi:hypothetical protein